MAGCVAWERILADDNIDKPPELKMAGEKLVAAAYLLQAMPEAQVLIEQAAVQQAESSVSRMRSAASGKAGETARQDHEASVLIPPG